MGYLDMAETPEDLVFMALGAASVCWSESPQGIFELERIIELGNELMQRLELR